MLNMLGKVQVEWEFCVKAHVYVSLFVVKGWIIDSPPPHTHKHSALLPIGQVVVY